MHSPFQMQIPITPKPFVLSLYACSSTYAYTNANENFHKVPVLLFVRLSLYSWVVYVRTITIMIDWKLGLVKMLRNQEPCKALKPADIRLRGPGGTSAVPVQ